LLIESLRLLKLMDQLHAFFRGQMAQRDLQRFFDFVGLDRKAILQFLDGSIGFRLMHGKILSPYRREIRIDGIALIQFLRSLKTFDWLDHLVGRSGLVECVSSSLRRERRGVLLACGKSECERTDEQNNQ
jgi:hypothetical protein